MSQLIPNSNPMILDNFCGQCGSELLAQDNFCRHCGNQAHGSEATVLAPVATSESKQASLIVTHPNTSRTSGTLANHNQQLSSQSDTIQTVLNNRLYVGMVIALIGPLGLPALWFSPRFSNRTKIVLTSIFVVLTTIVPLVIAWYFLDYSMRPLLEVFN